MAEDNQAKHETALPNVKLSTCNTKRIHAATKSPDLTKRM
jgi:hypothetical protein